MLSRINRFHGHGGVRRVYRQGKATRTDIFSMHVLKGERVKTSRVAVVVSRKVHKSAVKRNRIRRRVYELARHHLPELSTPAELVINVYQAEAADMPADRLEAAVGELLKKARL